MSTPDLTPTSYVVLGLVDLLGRATSYDLKRMVGMSIGYFWSFPHSQLYAEPARLAELGLLEAHEEEGGRRRRVYSATDEGREALREWLGDAGSWERHEIRDSGLLRLFLAGSARPADVTALAEREAEHFRRSLAELDSIREAIGEDEAFAFPLLTLELGRRVSRTCAEFWEDVAEGRPRRRDGAGRRHSSSR